MQQMKETSQPRRLFGTDGIRGRAGAFPLDPDTVRAIGASVARHIPATGERPRIVTGRDTRESGESIERAFCDGAAGEGAECVSAGVITTPGVAFVTGKFGFDAGVVISASHNPFEDNGIKIFSPDGSKMNGEVERAIEADVHGVPAGGGTTAGVELNGLFHSEYTEAYLDSLKERFATVDLRGIKAVIDCANGAASNLAPGLFEHFGAEVVSLHCAPNGRNINKDCGSLHLEDLQGRVVAENADVGIAFDGDADRALMVDEKGGMVDGDSILWIMSGYLRSVGRLTSSKVIGTVMSNFGLEAAMTRMGIELVRTPVGDKYVLEELLRSGAELGGEQSGHIIFPKRSLVGDGMATALAVLRAITEKGVTLSESADGFERTPQLLVNVRVREKVPFEESADIISAVKEVENELGDTGRLLLRYSGTENLARVMVEGSDQADIENAANRLADVIRETLG
ncbi:MAG TPA: phosphoglucosamine mutase [Pyrinomonadaceae bacterium]|nr:phosphoglucosamine mutase [Pyrinomonadaceae bacterium]